MLKLLKYEYRKNMVPYVILIVAFFALYAYSAISIISKSKENTAIGMMLFCVGMFVGIIYIMILAIETYSKELSSRTSYMIFMTPNSTYKIVGAKIFATFLASIVFTFVYLLMFYSLYKIFIASFPEVEAFQNIINQIMPMYGFSQLNVVATVVVSTIVMWMSIFTVVCIAYLAITLSRTLLSNKSGKGFLSFIFFLVIAVVYNLISNAIPKLELGNDTIMANIFSYGPSYVLDIVIIALCIIGTAQLLDKKISL